MASGEGGFRTGEPERDRRAAHARRSGAAGSARPFGTSNRRVRRPRLRLHPIERYRQTQSERRSASAAAKRGGGHVQMALGGERGQTATGESQRPGFGAGGRPP